MRLNELVKDEIVTLSVSIPDHPQMDFLCQIAEVSPKGQYILVPSIKYEDKILSFQGSSVSIELTAVRDGKPYVFKGCSVRFINTQKGDFHVITSKLEGVYLNRRAYFRVPVDEYGIITNERATLDAFVLNMSASGFAFILAKCDSKNMGMVQLKYNDSLVRKDIAVTGQEVRREKLDDGRTLIGCQMVPRNDVVKYLNVRQGKALKTKGK